MGLFTIPRKWRNSQRWSLFHHLLVQLHPNYQSTSLFVCLEWARGTVSGMWVCGLCWFHKKQLLFDASVHKSGSAKWAVAKTRVVFLHAQLNPLLTPLRRSRKFRWLHKASHCFSQKKSKHLKGQLVPRVGNVKFFSSWVPEAKKRDTGKRPNVLAWNASWPVGRHRT